jgi:hypothetical protein
MASLLAELALLYSVVPESIEVFGWDCCLIGRLMPTFTIKPVCLPNHVLIHLFAGLLLHISLNSLSRFHNRSLDCVSIVLRISIAWKVMRILLDGVEGSCASIWSERDGRKGGKKEGKTKGKEEQVKRCLVVR